MIYLQWRYTEPDVVRTNKTKVSQPSENSQNSAEFALLMDLNEVRLLEKKKITDVHGKHRNPCIQNPNPNNISLRFVVRFLNLITSLLDFVIVSNLFSGKSFIPVVAPP